MALQGPLGKGHGGQVYQWLQIMMAMRFLQVQWQNALESQLQDSCGGSGGCGSLLLVGSIVSVVGTLWETEGWTRWVGGLILVSVNPAGVVGKRPWGGSCGDVKEAFSEELNLCLCLLSYRQAGGWICGEQLLSWSSVLLSDRGGGKPCLSCAVRKQSLSPDGLCS